MNAYGITFQNWTKTFGDAADCRDKNAVQFFLFAALCSIYTVGHLVKEISYSSNDCSFWVEIDECYANNHIGDVFRWIAKQTLSQHIIFGICHHKES